MFFWFYLVSPCCVPLQNGSTCLEGHPIMRKQELTQALDLQHIQPEGWSYWGLSICQEPQGPHIRFIGETGLEDPKWWPRNAALHASLYHQIRQKWVAILLLDVGHGKHTKGTFCCRVSQVKHSSASWLLDVCWLPHSLLEVVPFRHSLALAAIRCNTVLHLTEIFRTHSRFVYIRFLLIAAHSSRVTEKIVNAC